MCVHACVCVCVFKTSLFHYHKWLQQPLLKVDCRTLLHTFVGKRLKFSKPLCFAVGFQWPCWTLSKQERQRGKRGRWMTGHRGNPGQKRVQQEKNESRRVWEEVAGRREIKRAGLLIMWDASQTNLKQQCLCGFLWSLTKGICSGSGHFPSLPCVPAIFGPVSHEVLIYNDAINPVTMYDRINITHSAPWWKQLSYHNFHIYSTSQCQNKSKK